MRLPFESEYRYVKKNGFWNIEVADLVRSAEENWLEIQERPIWAVALNLISEREIFHKITSHIFCCNCPEWAFSIKWGPLNEDGWTDKNLGYQMYRLGSWFDNDFGAWKQTRMVARVPVTREWIREHYPQVTWWPGDPVEDDGEDEMRCKPEDIDKVNDSE